MVAPAGTLTGTTLASNVVNSSLTSVGTLTSLTVSGITTLSNLTANEVVVTNGSDQLVSYPYTNLNTGSTIVQRDANGNTNFNNIVTTTTSSVTSNQTIPMNYGSAGYQVATGTANISYVLPDATTLFLTTPYSFVNQSTGTLTVYKHDGSTVVATVPFGGSVVVNVSNNSTVNGLWDALVGLANGSISGTNGTSLPGTLTLPAFNTAGVLINSATGLISSTAGPLPILNGGTGNTTGTATNATNIATTSVSTNATYYPIFVAATSGNQAADLTTGLSFNPSNNTLATTTFVGALTGTASGNLPLSGGTMTGALNEGVVVLTPGATVAVNATLGNIFKLTLNQNSTLSNPTGAVDGQKFVFKIKQPASGGPYTLALGSSFEFGQNIPSITLSTAANATDMIGVQYFATEGLFYVMAFQPGF